MNNDLITKRSWFKTNWKWLLPVLFLGIVVISKLSTDGNLTDFTKAYTDKSLFNNALKKVKTNERAIEILGNIEPIDDLAILEGDIKYSNDYNSVNASIRIKGDKAKGKMDISAEKINSIWIYKKLSVRIKPKNQIIEIQ
jgi:hypothetical protein